MATQYGRYDYRRITALLREDGWTVNAKRVERIWRLEGLKVPPRQPKRGRLWLTDDACVRLRPEYPNHVWAYDAGGPISGSGSVFRIGRLGDFNDLSLIGTLGGEEMGFSLTGVPYKKGGVVAAMDYLATR